MTELPLDRIDNTTWTELDLDALDLDSKTDQQALALLNAKGLYLQPAFSRPDGPARDPVFDAALDGMPDAAGKPADYAPAAYQKMLFKLGRRQLAHVRKYAPDAELRWTWAHFVGEDVFIIDGRRIKA